MPGPVPKSDAKRDGRERLLVAAGLLALAALPILLTPFPPSTDLPQHIAQVRLLREALAHPDGPYVIQWASPNTLVYYLILGLWTILPVGFVARAVLLLVVSLWVAAIHVLGAGRGRAWPAAVVASWLIFNRSFYWGFLNFLIGFPAFVLWFALTTEEPVKPSWPKWAALVGGSVLLYGSHALWFLLGGGWLIVMSLVKRLPVRAWVFRLTALVPCGLASFFWYPGLSSSRAMAGSDVAPHWSTLFDRLGSMLTAAMGGIAGLLPAVIFVLVYLWIGYSIWQNRERLRQVVDRDLLTAAAFFLAIVIVSPDKYMDTIFFSSRWLPPALIFLLLALPLPSFRKPVLKPAVAAVTAVFFLATAVAWREYDREDLAGFRESLQQIPAAPRVLGLDLIKYSEYLKDRPFLQLFAYVQVYRGGELNFSFAEHYSGLVAYRGKRDIRWSPFLVWYPEKVKRSDFASFDYVLVNGEEKDHRAMASFKELSALSGQGRWRVYRVARAR